jgi:hypothetical protein
MTVAIRALTVPRMHRRVYQGQSVNIMATIEDAGVTTPLLDIPDPPTIHVFNPSDVKIVDSKVMTRIATAIFMQTVQTANQPLGVYTASVIAHYGADIAVVEKEVVFKIVRTVLSTELPVFNVLAIKDQSGAIWYWWIAADDTIDWDDQQPVIPGYQGVDISTVFIPFWLQGLNPDAVLRYLYPSLDGAPTVSATQPAVGTGLTTIPSFVGLNLGKVYQPFIAADDTVNVKII